MGESPHRGTLFELKRHGIDAGTLIARQVNDHDFKADYLIAMDQEILHNLLQRGPARGQVTLFMDLLPEEQLKDVPDPYYVGNFDEVYRLIDKGCRRLLEKIKDDWGL